jgi:AcrR family transcriptional regulator
MKNETTPSKRRGSARERLLVAADALFYEEGVNTVGIDRVIELAGVAKASLYDCFGSKEELIRSYLAARFAVRRSRVEAKLGHLETPKEKILAVFDVMAEITAQPGFRGCPFVRAAAEARPDSTVRAVCADSRAWTFGLFRTLAAEAQAADAEQLAHQLQMLYDGATVAADLDGHRKAALSARALAEVALEAATRRGN